MSEIPIYAGIIYKRRNRLTAMTLVINPARFVCRGYGKCNEVVQSVRERIRYGIVTDWFVDMKNGYRPEGSL